MVLSQPLYPYIHVSTMFRLLNLRPKTWGARASDESRKDSDDSKNGQQAPLDQYQEDCEGARLAPIAICGVALRLPGGISHPDELWDLLTSNLDARSFGLATRHARGNGTTPEPGMPDGLSLGQGKNALDASFFSDIPKSFANQPQGWEKVLEVARECLDDACENGSEGKSNARVLVATSRAQALGMAENLGQALKLDGERYLNLFKNHLI